jgi:nucleoside-diphosphate-sugar epimerase
MVVITGASGLLGSIIAETFVSRNIPVTGLYNQSKPANSSVNWLQCDVTDYPTLVKIFEGAECVIHAAAIVSFAQKNKKKMFSINVEGTANVVNACLATGVKRLVHISSVAAIGKPVNESIISEKTTWAHASKPSTYGESKYLAELEVFRGEAEGLSVAAVNPSIILSAGNKHRSSGKIIQYVQDERSFYVDGYLNYVDARDVAEMVWQLYKNPQAKGRYIASAGTVAWRELFNEIGSRLGKKPPSIKVSPVMARIAAAIEWVRSTVTGSEPLITKETAKIARQKITYSNDRAVKDLGIKFRSLSDTLDWCCGSDLSK